MLKSTDNQKVKGLLTVSIGYIQLFVADISWERNIEKSNTTKGTVYNDNPLHE